jgi:hypothetical protein
MQQYSGAKCVVRGGSQAGRTEQTFFGAVIRSFLGLECSLLLVALRAFMALARK